MTQILCTCEMPLNICITFYLAFFSIFKIISRQKKNKMRLIFGAALNRKIKLDARDDFQTL